MIEMMCRLDETAYWNPICEWTISKPMKKPSIVGYNAPAAKGAIVSGISAAETALLSMVS